MKCRYNEKLVLYSIGELEDVAAEEVRRHLSQCASCRAELEKLAHLDQLIGEKADLTPPPDLWRGVEQRLARRRPSRVPARLQPAWRPALAVLTVMVLVVAAFYAMPILQPDIMPTTATLPLDAGDGYAEVQIISAWDTPFADKAALALAMLALEEEEITEAMP